MPFLVAWGNLLHRLSHVVLSALRFNGCCGLVLPSSAPTAQFLWQNQLYNAAVDIRGWHPPVNGHALQFSFILICQGRHGQGQQEEAGRVFLGPFALVNSASGPATPLGKDRDTAAKPTFTSEKHRIKKCLFFLIPPHYMSLLLYFVGISFCSVL